MTPELLSCKELAAVLKRPQSYVYAMRRRGFKMIAYRTTLAAALKWLEANPQPRGRSRTNSNQHGRIAR